MKTVTEIEVSESDGIRRFLYPLSVTVPGLSNVAGLRVADESGCLIPSQAGGVDGGAQVTFAVSLAPGEVRRLQVVETTDIPDISDPIRLAIAADGSIEAKQSRFAHRIDHGGRIESVAYDGVQHLAGAATVTLDDILGVGALQAPATMGDGLGGTLQYNGQYEGKHGKLGFSTRYRLTSCKSWIDVRHRIERAPGGSRIQFKLPMSAGGTTSTCDFGVGNGLYEKLQAGTIERILWHLELDDDVKWWVGSCALDSPSVRIDCEGKLPNRSSLGPCAWFHWIDSDKAIAVALTKIDDSCDRISIALTADGTIEIAFFVPSDTPHTPVEFGVCWHFLNDIPPIAAATNPASILLRPAVRVL